MEGKEGTNEKTIDFVKTSCYINVNIYSHVICYIGTLVLPCMKETESCLLHVVVIQVLSVAFPELLDKDPNYPYNQDLTTIIKTRV